MPVEVKEEMPAMQAQTPADGFVKKRRVKDFLTCLILPLLFFFSSALPDTAHPFGLSVLLPEC